MKQDMIVILDLGSSENTTLAREIRALGVYSEIYPHDITKAELQRLSNVKGIILNGGEHRNVDGVNIDVLPEIYEAGYPVLAIDHAPALCEQKLTVWPTEEQLKTFVFAECKAEANWNMKNFVADQVELIREQVKDRKVLLALSGGVDSSVVAALLLKAIGKQLYCVHVNHGLMRKGESESVIEVFQNQMDANLIYVDASERFLGKLKDVAEPEQKRKIIGAEFIRVFEEEARKLEGIDFLAQGTIYPDIVERVRRQRRLSNHITMLAGCRMTWRLNWWSHCVSCSRMKCVRVGWSWDFRMTWFSVSHSQGLGLVCAVLGLLRRIVWRRCVSQMRFYVRSLRQLA